MQARAQTRKPGFKAISEVGSGQKFWQNHFWQNHFWQNHYSNI